MDPLSLIVSPIFYEVIGSIASLIKEECGLVIENKEDLESLSSTLSSTLEAISDMLEVAEKKQIQDVSVRKWVGKLNDAACEAGDELEIFATEARLWQKKKWVKNSCFSLCLWKASRKLSVKEIINRIDKIKEEKIFLLNDRVDDLLRKKEEGVDNGMYKIMPLVNESEVVGRKIDIKDIKDKLLKEFDGVGNNNIRVILITGMGGMGKTTLAQLVYNDKEVKEHFKDSNVEYRMWASVTVNFDLTMILKQMLGSLSMSNECDVSSLPEILAERRFLLVLDDVWIENYPYWEPLKQILGRGKKGSRVLVTSRNADVSKVMGAQYVHDLDKLPEPECRSLFEKIAFIKECNLAESVRKELEKIGSDIVAKCKGLPLAVKAMAGLLRGNNDVNKWRRILRHEIWEAEEGSQSTNTGKPMVLPALKLSYESYDQLSFRLKQCFAYCYIFPKGCVFDKLELVKLWKAVSFIQPREGDAIDDIGSDYFDELLQRSFFQKFNSDNKERYRMPDLIHDLAQSVSSPYCCRVKDSEPSHISERSRHVSLLCKDVEKYALEVIDKSKKLRTLLSPGPGEYLKDFGQSLDKMFRTLKYIRVLDLSSSTMEELPKSVEELKLLRYLDLSKTKIRKLPNSICNLYNLQTLKLLGCIWLFKLPKDLRKLVNLQHLELDDTFWDQTSTLPPRMGSITGLRNLHAFLVGDNKSGYGIEELENMEYLTGTLHISRLENAVDADKANLKNKERLKKVVFEWSYRDGGPQDEAKDEKALEDLQPAHSNLEELQIFHYKGAKFPSWIKDKLFHKLVTVSINHCTKCKALPLSRLPHLEQLYIKGMQELEELEERKMQELEELEETKMQELEQLEEDRYPSLKRLKISSCPKLTDLQIFPELTDLKIKKCDSLKGLPLSLQLEYLTLDDNVVLEDWNGTICYDSAKIINCPKLQALPEDFYARKLNISGCQLLSSLPSSLEHLELDACHNGNLEGLIPVSLHSLVISNISSITSLPKWPRLPWLRALCIRDCKDLVSPSKEEASFQCLTSLKLLSIRDCPKLVTLPDEGLHTALEYLSIGSCPSLKSLGPKGMMKSLTSLKDLYIEDCPALQSLPEEGFSTSLKHLHVKGCPLLTEQCQKDRGLYWPKIKNIPDLELESVDVPSVPNSEAWYHHFTCCEGIDKQEISEPQQGNSFGLMQSEKGQTSKGTMVTGDPSTSAEHALKPFISTVKKADRSNEVFLEHRRKKRWVDKSGNVCFMFYPRSLYICWGDNEQCWTWNRFKETSGENIEVAKLLRVRRLEVVGKLNISELSPEVDYEIAYIVKLTNHTFGWNVATILKLTLPDGNIRERHISLLEKPRGQWIELNVGNFRTGKSKNGTRNGENEELRFHLINATDFWKGGLVIKGAIIRHKN